MKAPSLPDKKDEMAQAVMSSKGADSMRQCSLSQKPSISRFNICTMAVIKAALVSIKSILCKRVAGIGEKRSQHVSLLLLPGP
jgi:hypothetical protein